MQSNKKVSRDIGLAMIKSYGAMQEIFMFFLPIEVLFFQGMNSYMYNVGVFRCQMVFRLVYFPDPCIFTWFNKKVVYKVSDDDSFVCRKIRNVAFNSENTQTV